jgi:hypothetical protein
LPLELKALDADGQVASDFSGSAFVKVSDPASGALSHEKVQFVNGVARVNFASGNRAGEVVISAETEGVESGALTLRIRPGDPVALRLMPLSFGQRFISNTRQVFEVSVLDAFGNTVDNDMSTEVIVTEQSDAPLLEIPESTWTVEGGRVEVPVTTEPGSGLIRLSAEAAGLSPAVWEGHLTHAVGAEFF